MSSVAEQKIRLAAIVVTAVLLLQLLWGGGRVLFVSSPAPIVPVSSALEPGIVNLPTPALEAGEFVERPLFWVGRQAFSYQPGTESSGEVGPAVANTIGNVKLLGIYSGGIIVSHDGKRRRVSIEDKLGGWTFSLMSPDQAYFTNGEKSTTLELKHAAPGQSAAARKLRPERKKRRAANKKRTELTNSATNNEQKANPVETNSQ